MRNFLWEMIYREKILVDCKSKCQVWRIFEKLNSANTRILRMTGTYKCKLEFTKPNKLHTCDSYDRMVTDQTPVPENGHTNRR